MHFGSLTEKNRESETDHIPLMVWETLLCIVSRCLIHLPTRRRESEAIARAVVVVFAAMRRNETAALDGVGGHCIRCGITAKAVAAALPTFLTIKPATRKRRSPNVRFGMQAGEDGSQGKPQQWLDGVAVCIRRSSAYTQCQLGSQTLMVQLS